MPRCRISNERESFDVTENHPLLHDEAQRAAGRRDIGEERVRHAGVETISRGKGEDEVVFARAHLAMHLPHLSKR